MAMKEKILPYILIISILGIAYGFTIAPGLSWANGGADGGDLITAAAVNGVPHPTGYPLYMVTAKAFQALPVGNLAFRTNLMSAVCTILAALLVYMTIVQVLQRSQYRRISGTVAALAFGLSPLVWSQAVISEVYGLQSLLTIGIVYQTNLPNNYRHRNLLRGILFGLALGNHITTIFLLPLILVDIEPLRLSPIRHNFLRFLGILAGTTIYVLLPLRAMQQPAINWFNPINLKSFFQFVSGELYQSYFSTRYAIERARAWAGYLLENFNITGAAIGIYAVLDLKKQLSFNLIITWIFCAYGLFAIFFASYDSYVYLIQSMLAFSLWIGSGFDALFTLAINRFSRANRYVFPLLTIIFFIQIALALPKATAVNDRRAELFGQEVFNTVPKRAMIFTRDDPTTFALWYFHFAAKMRQDTHIIAEGLLSFDWYRQSLRSIYPSLHVQEVPALTPFQLINQNPEYPFCFVEFNGSTKINCSEN